MIDIAVLSSYPLLSQIVEKGERSEHKGTEFILEELTDSVIIPLPKVFGVDLSITKAVVVMWIASAILIALFAFAFRRRSLVPHGLANFLEMVIVFLYKDVFTPYLGEHARRFAPFLLTLFFFILVNNLLGLVPPNFKATANISVTSGLSVITFIVVIGSGIKRHGLKGYAAHFFPKGIPWFVLVILAPIEVLGLVTRHAVLAVRLFANMFAGDMVLLTMIGFIFLFESYAIAPFSLLGAVAVGCLKFSSMSFRRMFLLSCQRCSSASPFNRNRLWWR